MNISNNQTVSKGESVESKLCSSLGPPHGTDGGHIMKESILHTHLLSARAMRNAQMVTALTP